MCSRAARRNWPDKTAAPYFNGPAQKRCAGLGTTYRLGMSGPIHKNMIWDVDLNFPKDADSIKLYRFDVKKHRILRQ